MEAPLQQFRMHQIPNTQDSRETVEIILELLKKYFLPVHVEVLCRGYKKETGSDLPFRDYGFASAAEFLRDGCGNAFEVTRSLTDSSVFKIAPKNIVSNGKNLTLTRDPVGKVPSESEKVRRVLQMLNHGNVATPRKKKMVPPQFRQYLRFLISRHPSGITAENLIKEFLRVSGSPLSYEMYGYPGYLEMFKDLSDVFTVEEENGDNVLYPASDHQKPSIPVRSLSKTFMKPIVVDPPRKPSPISVRAKPAPSEENLRFHDVGKLGLESGGSLVYVKLNGKYYIPTPCLASLAGSQTDTILKTLEENHVEIQGIEVLRESVQEHAKLRYEIALVQCPLVITKAGVLIREIPLVPLKAVRILLLVFGSRMDELEACFQRIQGSFARA